ncbi:MAG TPA: YciI family protein [Euzebyales bacterium]|nr:YciI family protein [Euzebyales bacterium]
MKYLYLIYLDEKAMAALPEDELEQVQTEAGTQVEELEASGHLVAAMALEPVKSSATVRVRSGDLSVTDGPFAETNEQLGGFAVIEASDLNEAIQLAAKDPAARYGSVEVRRIVWSSAD